MDQNRNWLTILLFLAMSVSSFVMVEPSPYDLLMILFIGMGFLFSIYRFDQETILASFTIYIFLLTNLLSLFFISKVGSSLFFTAITFYLASSLIGLIGIGHLFKSSLVELILKGYLLSACVSALLGILSYFHVLPFSEMLLMYGRVKAFFKDPNVFGPYLVIPALFALSMTELKDIKGQKKIFFYICFIMLTAGIVLSFSRAAWGNFAVSLCIYLTLVKVHFFKRRLKTIRFLLCIVLPAIFVFVQTPLVEDLLSVRLSYQNYDDQRFGTQLAAFERGLSNPLGIGAGQSDAVFRYSPHSLYARIFTENGVIGLLSMIFLFCISMIKAFTRYLEAEGENSLVYLVVFASLIGIAFNSFFVDTLHWRHLWVLLALSWMPVSRKTEKTYQQS